MPSKTCVAVLYGGKSAEHDVSILSARNVLGAIDRQRFDVVPIEIGRNGRWRMIDEATGSSTAVALAPGSGRLVEVEPSATVSAMPQIDVLFPVLHGRYGEDGAMQGYAEMAGIAYVGCGIFASAAAMDKDMTKRLLSAAGVPVAASTTLVDGPRPSFEDLSRALGSTLFVKPACQGSSVGVSRVGGNGTTLDAALDKAFETDDKVLVEAFVDGREIECAVLQRPDGSLIVTDPGEIVTAGHHDFYSYDAKYIDANGALVHAQADLLPQTRHAARDLAERAFRALGCEGMARVDLFLATDGRLIVNEINTIPGFTDISMYAKALAAAGIPYRQVISVLIDHALTRHARNRQRAH